MGWGKTGPAHSSPLHCFPTFLFICQTFGLNYSYTESEHSWYTNPKEKFKLQAFSQMILLNRGGERLGRPILSPLSPPKCYFLSTYLYIYTTLSLYLSSHDDRNMSRKNPSLLIANFTKCLAYWFFKTRPPKCFDHSIYLWPFGLCCSFIASEHLWISCFKERIKFSNQTVYWYCYIVGWGKTGSAHSFPPPKCFDLSIYLSVFWIMQLFDCIWTILKDQFQSEN